MTSHLIHAFAAFLVRSSRILSGKICKPWLGFVFALGWMLLGGCQAQPTPAAELVLYGWDGDIPEDVLDDFADESGVRVRYVAYASQEQAIDNIRSGARYDVLTMDSRFIPLLQKEGRLLELEPEAIPNRKNISPEFLNLPHDPANRYSIPFNWGTAGIIYRRDLVAGPITGWNDFWDARYAKRVGIWNGVPREMIGLTLKSLGYSANSEKRNELEAALERLQALKPNAVILEEIDPNNSVEALASGKVVLALGYADDVTAAREEGLDVGYVLPKEGALLWSDALVIPSTGENKKGAMQFLDFVLRPEISARIANANYFAMANQAARPLLESGLLNDPVIFPSAQDLENAERVLPLTSQGQGLHDYIWALYLAQNK